MAAHDPWWLAGSFLLAAMMARRGLKKSSLSKTGALAALIVGTIHMSAGLAYGATLIAFYLSSSKLTKTGAARKAQLEDGHREGGQRGAVQVLSNSIGGVLAIQAQALVRHPQLVCSVLARGAQGDACIASGTSHLQLACTAAFLGHFACCCADTWASELGILSQSSPRLILPPWRGVPPGTNGGVTPAGLAASAAGSAFIGATWLSAAGAATWVGPAAVGIGLPLHASQAVPLFLVACVSGLLGSVLDSLLGAVLQFSGWHEGRRVVVCRPGPGVKHITGIDLLSNNMVNFLSALASGCVAAALMMAV